MRAITKNSARQQLSLSPEALDFSQFIHLFALVFSREKGSVFLLSGLPRMAFRVGFISAVILVLAVQALAVPDGARGRHRGWARGLLSSNTQ